MSNTTHHPRRLTSEATINIEIDYAATIDKPHALRFADSVSLALEYRAGQAHQLRLLEIAS